jgi:DNA repair photolyase
VEPSASPVENRINALKEVHESGINTYVFISPILPFLTDWKDIIKKTQNHVDYFLFEKQG